MYAGQLFSRLGVFCESDAVRQEALAEWLRENEPVPNLRLALEFRGLIDDEGRAVPIPPDGASDGSARVA